MTVTQPTSTRRPWAKAIARIANEFALTDLPILQGSIPDGLRGTLYRNGPARLERGGQPVGHWFDGDGAILAIHLTDAQPQGVYRYVQTKGYQAESQAGRFLYSNYGMKDPEPIWSHWIKAITNSLEIKNAANTSVLALPDKLLALWEGGQPHALDLVQLTTLGRDNLGGLSNDQPYSAHPKRDPHTGEIYNIGIGAGKDACLNLYKSDRTGKIIKQAAIQLDGVPLIHSFVMAGSYLIFLISPVRLNLLPVLVGFASFSDALQWHPKEPTQILVIDRDTLEVVSRGEAPPWFQWHCGNGCVDSDGMVSLDLVRYPDFIQTNTYLKEVATGETHTASHGTLWHIRLDPKTAHLQSMQQVLTRECEFPVVPPHQDGQPWRYTYLSIHRTNADIRKEVFGAIARFDYETGTLTETNLPDNHYPMEPLFAADMYQPDRGWVITVVYNGNADTSEVWIFDSDRLDDEPVCRIGLPEVIPIGFHGTWKPS